MAAREATHVLTAKDRSIPGELWQFPGLRLHIASGAFKVYEDLSGLPDLVQLTIMDYAPASFTPLAGLRTLRILSVTHFPNVESLEPLAGLADLEELTLQTLPSWDASGKRQVVESLRPLASLGKLRSLSLGGVIAHDGDLAPLGGLEALEQLALGNMYPQAQFARLAARLPRARCNFLAPFLRLDGYACRKCGSEKVMLSGADVPNPKVVCPTCHKKKFDATIAMFEKHRQSP
jgi:hypothetical protein